MQQHIKKHAPLAFVLLLMLGAYILYPERKEDAIVRGQLVAYESNPEALFQALVDRNLVAHATVPALLESLDFDYVFPRLTVDELLTILLTEGFIEEGFGNLASLKAALPGRRVIGLDHLRPDGLLTELASADYGSLLSGAVLKPYPVYYGATETKNRLRTLFKTDPLQFFETIAPERILALLDDASITSVKDARDRLHMYTWKETTEGTPDMTYAFELHLRRTGTVHYLTDPGEAAAATALMPEGHKSLRIWNMATQYVPNSAPLASIPSHDHVELENLDGDMVTIQLPWMDTWEEVISERLDDWFRSYKEDHGGELDSMIYDQENYRMSVYSLINQQSDSSLKLPAGTVWNTITSDPRWPALEDELRAAGIHSFDNIGSWHNQRDYRAMIWSGVMQRRRTAYLHRGVYEPIAKHFPHVRFSNFDDTYRNQTHPVGKPLRMPSAWHGIGGIVGTHQQVRMYGTQGGSPLETPYGDINSIPPLVPGVYSIVGEDGFLTITMFEDIEGLEPGDEIRINAGASVKRNPNGSGNVPMDHSPFTGTYLVYQQLDPKTIVVEMLPEKVGEYDLAESWGPYPILRLYIYRPYNAFVADLLQVRSQVTSSHAPVYATVSGTGYPARDIGYDYTHRGEAFLHVGLNGSDDYEYWNSDSLSPPESDLLYQNLLNELSFLIGYDNRRTLSFDPISWRDDYVLTGMDAGGRKVWRLTPNSVKHKTTTILSHSPAIIQLGTGPTSVTFSLPRSRIHTFDSPASPYGYWIIQDASPTLLRTTAGAALRALAGRSPQVVEHTMETEEMTVSAGEQISFLVAGLDPESPPQGRNIETLPIALQGLALGRNALDGKGEFLKVPYNIGVARGEVYLFVWTPDEEDVGEHTLRFVTQEGEPLAMTVNVVP